MAHQRRVEPNVSPGPGWDVNEVLLRLQGGVPEAESEKCKNHYVFQGFWPEWGQNSASVIGGLVLDSGAHFVKSRYGFL